MLMSDLIHVIESVRDTARAADVKIVAGDTKVVGKGEADQLFINTAGIGVIENASISIKNVRPGQKLFSADTLETTQFTFYPSEKVWDLKGIS